MGNEVVDRIRGDKELIRAFKHMKDSSVRRIMRPAIRSGLSIANKEAKRIVPKASGRLKKAIGAKMLKSRKHKISGKIYVRPGYESKDSDPRKYAHLVEFGTEHTKARPFMRRAMGEKREAIDQAIQKKARERLNKEADRARKKGKRL